MLFMLSLLACSYDAAEAPQEVARQVDQPEALHTIPAAQPTPEPEEPSIDATVQRRLKALGYTEGPKAADVAATGTKGVLAEKAKERGWDGEGYKDYGINPLTLVQDDRFSTFAADVDTASYSLARGKLNKGYLPVAAGVRVEEFVNSLDYGYEPPEAGSNDDAPFAVHMEAAPSPWDGGKHILRIGVKGQEPKVDRKPVHLTFLVDTSGSMTGPDKLDMVKYSLHYVVDHLSPGDTVAIATYAGSTAVLLEATDISEKAAAHRVIDRLGAGGGTAMNSGMQAAYDLALDSYAPDTENRVVVMSDGDANIGPSSFDTILAGIEGYAGQGITLSTIGFGMGDYQDVMMEQLANQGDGNYFYIDDYGEAEEVFGERLSGNMVTIARDVKLQVEFNPDAVYAYRLIGYENRDIADHDFRNDKVDAGEIGAGHTVTALYEVSLKKDARSQELATVRVRAKKPGPESPAKEWATVFQGANLHSEAAEASRDFRLAVAAAAFAELLRGSPYVSELSYFDVEQLARRAANGAEDALELADLAATAGRLSGEVQGPTASR